MAIAADDITLRMGDLADAAFESFCDDIGGMFGVDMRCERRQAGMESVRTLQSWFKKLAVIHVVQGRGALEGQFHLLFDQGGLFVLSGVAVMLPQARILEELKRGSIESIDHLKDPAQEVGNLLVGSWDRVFRAGCKGHGHFLKEGTSIGKPIENPAMAALAAAGEVFAALYEMKVEPYPSFQCAVALPKPMLVAMTSGTEAPVEPAAEEEPPAAAAATPVQKPAAAKPAAPPAPPAAKPEAPAKAEQRTGAAEHPKPVQAEQPAPPKVAAAAPAAPQVVAPAPVVVAPTVVPPAPEKPPAVAPRVVPTSVDRPPPSDPGGVSAAPRAGDAVASDLLRLTAAQIMESKVVWAGPESTVQDVIVLMQQHNCGYVLIGANGTIEGLVSRSDVLGAVSLYLRPMFARWRRPEDDATLGVKVKWIMSRPVRTVRPDAGLAAMIECMRHFGGRCLPVVDERGSVQGLVTVFDILLRILESDSSFSWKGAPQTAPALML